MNTFKFNLLAIALGLALSGAAMAQPLSKADYKAAKQKISVDYKTAKAGCASLAANVKDICVVEAKGKEKVALAELEVSDKPSPTTRYKLRVAQAEAAYAVARERCDDLAGNPKDVCAKEAKAARTAAEADAKVQMKTTDANATAASKTAAARNAASSTVVDARKDASADKMAAQYKVEQEKCDAFAGSAKTACLDRAKMNFGKP